AERRGLPNIRTAPEAFAHLVQSRHMDMLVKQTGVFTASELRSRYHIINERYAKDVLIEAETLLTMVAQQIVPAAFEYRKGLAEAAAALKAVGAEAGPEVDALNELAPLVATLQAQHRALAQAVQHAITHHSDDANEHARLACETLVPAIASTREAADALEVVVADKYWPLPKYTELLLTI
ncbi:hypothetical protein GGI00_001544, partial [Coemansia sp. RSA 2681]